MIAIVVSLQPDLEELSAESLKLYLAVDVRRKGVDAIGDYADLLMCEDGSFELR